MPTPFAALEARAAAAQHALLANATVTWYRPLLGLETSVDVVFDSAAPDADGQGLPGSPRNFTAGLPESALADLAPGVEVTVRDARWKIARVDRDRAGWATLHLRGVAA